jgi:hypothetical protein
MSEQELDELRAKIWRGALSGVEARRVQTLLDAHPELRDALGDDLALNTLLESAPEAPAVSSNFTSVVLEKVRLQQQRDSQNSSGGIASIARWLKSIFHRGIILRAGLAFSVVIAMGSLAYRQNTLQQRTLLAQSVTTVSQAFVTDSKFVSDIKPILSLQQEQESNPDAPKADVELLALMR